MTETLSPPPAADPPRPANSVGLGLLLAWMALGALLVRDANGPLTFAFVVLGWVLSVMAHEFSHAGVAYLGGDHSVVAKGYLSFDPRRYGDVGTSVVLPLLALVLGGFGLPGGAVYLRPDLMRGPGWRSASAAAGPAATLGVLLVLVGLVRLWQDSEAMAPLLPALSLLAFLQAMALMLNLLPVPGLDGFNILRPFLPASLAPHLRRAEGLATGLLFLAIFLVPGVGGALFRWSAMLTTALGVDPALLSEGWRAFHFWG